jgi:hypothetical protein
MKMEKSHSIPQVVEHIQTGLVENANANTYAATIVERRMKSSQILRIDVSR